VKALDRCSCATRWAHRTQVRCPHCGGEDFDLGSAMLNTVGLTFLELDWANRSGSLLICVKCSHIEWFLEEPERV